MFTSAFDEMNESVRMIATWNDESRAARLLAERDRVFPPRAESAPGESFDSGLLRHYDSLLPRVHMARLRDVVEFLIWAQLRTAAPVRGVDRFLGRGDLVAHVERHRRADYSAAALGAFSRDVGASRWGVNLTQDGPLRAWLNSRFSAEAMDCSLLEWEIEDLCRREGINQTKAKDSAVMRRIRDRSRFLPQRIRSDAERLARELASASCGCAAELGASTKSYRGAVERCAKSHFLSASALAEFLRGPPADLRPFDFVVRAITGRCTPFNGPRGYGQAMFPLSVVCPGGINRLRLGRDKDGRDYLTIAGWHTPFADWDDEPSGVPPPVPVFGCALCGFAYRCVAARHPWSYGLVDEDQIAEYQDVTIDACAAAHFWRAHPEARECPICGLPPSAPRRSIELTIPISSLRFADVEWHLTLPARGRPGSFRDPSA